ncbi:hypothetical protein D623_10019169 [Myotis brandtii]|uniref:Uncharacterized protein n=1 Tax=Myotis brandtii TaxID=109478 RepID=S7N4Y2_MYOBR|nr:hypothetical protein D623_10019169 [Myotis brandtii]
MLVTPLFSLLLGLLPSEVLCQQRGSGPGPGQGDGEVETECRGREGICPPPQREKAGTSEDLSRLQHCTDGLALASGLPHRDGCLQEPSQSMPPCSLSPTAPAPHT